MSASDSPFALWNPIGQHLGLILQNSVLTSQTKFIFCVQFAAAITDSFTFLLENLANMQSPDAWLGWPFAQLTSSSAGIEFLPHQAYFPGQPVLKPDNQRSIPDVG
jgi:hypothetical protein